MNTSTITDLELPDVRLPSLEGIGNLVPVDDIVDLADTAVTRVRRLLPWTSNHSGWKRYAVPGAIVLAALIAVVALKRRSSDQGSASEPTPIHRAA